MSKSNHLPPLQHLYQRPYWTKNAMSVKKQLIMRAIPIFVVFSAKVFLIPSIQFYPGGPSVTFLKNQKRPGLQIPLQANSVSSILKRSIMSSEMSYKCLV